MPARVLVVEDDRFIREVVAIALRADGYVVDAVEDGDMACRYLAEKCPSAVVLDLALPYVDGLTICRQLRATPCSAMLPILITSAAPGDDVARTALAAGANAFLHKPFDLGELIDCLHRISTSWQHGDRSADAVPCIALPQRPSGSAESWRLAVEGQTARSSTE